MAISRRTFLKTVGAGAAATALAGELQFLTQGIGPAAAGDPTNFVYSMCGICSNRCSIKAGVVSAADKTPLELSGNPLSQTDRGKICVKGKAGLAGYRNPNRLKNPMKRTNPNKGPGEDPGWLTITWAEALALVAEQMKTAIDTYGGESIVFLHRPPPDFKQRLVKALGTPNEVCHISTCYATHGVVWASTVKAADAAKTKYVETTDYTIDYTNGTITRVGAGAIGSGKVVYVAYTTGGGASGYTDFVKFDVDTKNLRAGSIDAGSVTVCSPLTKIGDRNWVKDLSRSNYILCFGYDQPAKAKTSHTQDFVKALKAGAKAVVFNPLLTTTGELAIRYGGEYRQITPGTDLAVALGMIHWIVNNNKHNAAYVTAGCTGWTELQTYFTTGAGSSYTPAWADGVAGLTAGTVAHIAQEFCNNGDYSGGWKAVIPTHKRDAGGPNFRNGWRLSHAVVILNALVGEIDRLGGEVCEKKYARKNIDWVCPPPAYPSIRPERIDKLHLFPIMSKIGKGSQPTVADGILAKDPYEVKVVWARKSGVLSYPNPQRLIDALKTVFLIALDFQPTEIVQMADVVLPEVYYLEGRGFDDAEYFALWRQLITFQPVKTLYSGTKGYRKIVPDLANAFGEWRNSAGYRVKDYFRYNPGGTYSDTNPFIEDVNIGGQGTGKGSLYYDHAVLKELGVSLGDTNLGPDTNYNSWTGGWAYIKGLPGVYSYETGPLTPGDPLPAGYTPSYGTAAKKVALYSQLFKDYGYDPLPKWVTRRDSPSGDFNLAMVITRPAWHLMTTTQHWDLLAEIESEGKLIINPTDAGSRGIVTGDAVSVSSRTGNTLTLKALVTDRIMQGVVCVPHGWGHWSPELGSATGKGGNDGDLIPIRSVAEQQADGDPTTGALMEDVYVKVVKA